MCRKGSAHDPKHTIESMKRCGGGDMGWVCLTANGTGAFVFIDDVTADKSNRINSEVLGQYYLIIFSQMLQDSVGGTSSSPDGQ